EPDPAGPARPGLVRGGGLRPALGHRRRAVTRARGGAGGPGAGPRRRPHWPHASPRADRDGAARRRRLGRPGHRRRRVGRVRPPPGAVGAHTAGERARRGRRREGSVPALVRGGHAPVDLGSGGPPLRRALRRVRDPGGRVPARAVRGPAPRRHRGGADQRRSGRLGGGVPAGGRPRRPYVALDAAQPRVGEHRRLDGGRGLPRGHPRHLERPRPPLPRPPHLPI
ncbi:MAG: Phosphoglycerate mutase family protein, partial [uncultured Nocardioides sp.]